ncbi:MAG: DUF2493 domain-containing protein, partial [Microcystis panniformis]
MLKIIIAGSRNFNDYNLLEQKVNFYIGENQDIEIISGTARGADRLGERYAINKGLKFLLPAMIIFNIVSSP